MPASTATSISSSSHTNALTVARFNHLHKSVVYRSPESVLSLQRQMLADQLILQSKQQQLQQRQQQLQQRKLQLQRRHSSALKSLSSSTSGTGPSVQVPRVPLVPTRSLGSLNTSSTLSSRTITSSSYNSSRSLNSNLNNNSNYLSASFKMQLQQHELRHEHKQDCNDDEHSVSTATITTDTTGLSSANCQNKNKAPLQLPNFKPAVGCIRADDFLIRCFVTRLKTGVTVLKYSRSKLQTKAKPMTLRLVSINPHTNWEEQKGTSLSDMSLCHQYALTWSPATKPKGDGDDNGTNNTHQKNKARSAKVHAHDRRCLLLRNCHEVRMASTPDPDHPQFTGTTVLRDKCDPANSHKSFALIFSSSGNQQQQQQRNSTSNNKSRTLDITAMTADQCTMLTEGLTALCYRIHSHHSHINHHTNHHNNSKTTGNKKPSNSTKSKKSCLSAAF